MLATVQQFDGLALKGESLPNNEVYALQFRLVLASQLEHVQPHRDGWHRRYANHDIKLHSRMPGQQTKFFRPDGRFNLPGNHCNTGGVCIHNLMQIACFVALT